MKYFYLVLLCLYVCIAHPVIHIQIDNDIELAQRESIISQNCLYEQTKSHHYTVYNEYINTTNSTEIQKLREQYKQTLLTATYIISFIQNSQQMFFYETALTNKIPILTFCIKQFPSLPSDDFHLINHEQILNFSNQLQADKIKKIIKQFIKKNSPNFQSNLIIPRQTTSVIKAKDEKEQSKLSDYKIAIYVIAGEGSGGWWTWAKNMISIAQIIGHPKIAFKQKKQRIPFRELKTFDFIIMQNPVYQILQQMPFQMRRRTYLGPFVLNHPFDESIRVKQKHSIRQLLNGTNIIVQVGGKNLKQKCIKQRKNAIIDCIAFQQGINPNQWKPRFQKQTRTTPLIYYKQRPQNETPKDLRHGLSTYLLHNQIFHYQVLITKRKYNQQENILYPTELFRQLLMKTNYMISFSSYGSYENFMYQTWSCDIPLVSFWFNPIQYFENRAGQMIKISQSQVSYEQIESAMTNFLNNFNADYYTPRQLIIKNHNINNQANVFLQLVRKNLNQIRHKKDIVN